jgi:excinuclease UvrABC nuclease subunit
MEAPMSHLDELKEQLEEAVAAQDFDTAAKLRGEIDSIQHSAKIRAVEEPAQAAYFHQRQAEEEGRKPPSR